MSTSDRSKPIAIIPARSGSKRLRRKNIHPILGRPMIAYSIEAAQTSQLFGSVIVTTDDPEFAEVAAREGAKVINRPTELATDSAGLIDVLRFMIADQADFPDVFCLLQANCPLRNSDDIVGSYEAFQRSGAPAMVSVTSFGWTPPFRALVLKDHGLDFLSPIGHKKSQEYPDVVCTTGAIYWARSPAIAQADSLYVEGLAGYRMPWHRAVDIDTEEDLKIAACVAFAEKHGFSFDEAVR